MKKTMFYCVLTFFLTSLFPIQLLVFIQQAKALSGVANGSAYLVIGQTNMTNSSANQGGSVSASGFGRPAGVFYAGGKLIVGDMDNHRVLIYNSIPTSSNASADVVIGQANMTNSSANQGGSVGANTLNTPEGVYSDGTKLFVVDTGNHRVLIYNSIPTSNNASADVVIGQANMTSNSANRGGSAGANTLNYPAGIYSDGTKLFISDMSNSRVLIYNSIPTSNNASADVVIGQANMTSVLPNRGGSAGANTLNYPAAIYCNGTKLLVYDGIGEVAPGVFLGNSRVLIYNSIPTSSNASADVVIGQANMTSNSANQGGSVGANTLSYAGSISSDGTKLFLGDSYNHRVLIYNSIPTSSNASADVVIGQANMTSNSANQGGSVAANTLKTPSGLIVVSNKIITGDGLNYRVLIYRLRPTLTEEGAIGTTNDSTPNYTFNSDEAGTINYGGDCSSSSTTAAAGDNTVTFNSLSDGTHDNCTITVTNEAGIASAAFNVTSFTIDTTPSTVSGVINGTTYHTNITPVFTGGATLNGNPFVSGDTITEDGDYILIVTDLEENVTTIQFKIEKISTNTPLVTYSNKRSANRKITLTLWGLRLSPKAKSKYFSVKLNGKRIRVLGATNKKSNLYVILDLKYGKWSKGNYDLSLTYKYRDRTSNKWRKTSLRKNGILKIQ